MAKKRMLAILFVLCMLLTIAAGCSGKNDGESSASSGTATESNSADQAAQPVKVTVTIRDTKYDSDHFNKMDLTQEIKKGTNVELDFNVITGSSKEYEEKLRLMMSANQQSDIIQEIGDNFLSNMMANKKVVDMKPYITKESTPNITAAFSKKPTLKAVATLPDGGIYSLPFMEEVYQTWMENNMFINKNWLDKLGLDVPKTTEEFVSVLQKFKEEDPNGNGQPDEIPLSFIDNYAAGHIEAFLGVFGIPTKYGTNDGYTFIDNGKVVFAPTNTNYKEAMLYLRSLEQAKLIDVETFTQNEAAFSAKLTSNPSLIGCFFWPSLPPEMAEDYMAIPYPKSPVAEPKVWINPGVIGGKRMGTVITSNCKNVEAVIKMFDRYYNAQDYYRFSYGSHATYIENGMLKFKEDSAVKEFEDKGLESRFINLFSGIVLKEDVGKTVDLPNSRKSGSKFVDIYSPYIHIENIWPRPMYTTEEADQLAQIRTDVLKTVQEAKARFIVDTKIDFNKTWDKYVSSLDKVGLPEMLKIMQTAYDRYKQNQQ